MAEKALKKLEEQLNCSICLDVYTDPKVLQCFHVYCQQCLVPLVLRNQHGITCPNCRQVTPIPDRGVAGLPPAFHINHLLELQASFQHIENPAAVCLKPAATTNSPNARHCFEHPEEELKLYCETCGELVCFQCIMKDSKHHDHEYALLKRAFEKYKEEILSSFAPMEKQVASTKKALVRLDTCCRKITHQRAATVDEIHGAFRRLRDILDVREIELIGQLDSLTQGKLKDLASQKDQIETTLAQMNSCLHFMRESLKTGNEEDVLMMKTNTVAQVKELITLSQPQILEPDAEANVIFSTTVNVAAVCQNYGQIRDLLDLSKCYATGKGIELAEVGEKSIAILHADCKELITSLECKIVSEITGTGASCSVERRGQSQYKISYQPTIKGRHLLHIKAEGQHVSGSPFSVAVKSPVEKLGTPIKIIAGVQGPRCLAINQMGEVVVAEWDRRCISVFNSSGVKLQSIHVYGYQQETFVKPHGVAVDSEGNILVADGGKHCVQKFTAEGIFVNKVGGMGRGPLQFNFPSDIACMGDKLYVVDGNNHRIQVLYSDFTISSIFGGHGCGNGQFNFPRGIACDSAGKVHVADSGNHRIQVFTAEGKFLGMFRWCDGGRELNCPTGVAIDTNDMVYVSELNCVSVFTSVGQCVKSFGRLGNRPGEFCNPYGVAVDNCGVVYVSDSENNRLQIF